MVPDVVVADRWAEELMHAIDVAIEPSLQMA
jgi:hypothetical protein